MVSSNPREPLLWTPRTQEIMGGFNPREVLDHDINPNEDSDGLSHHGLETPEDSQSRDQQDPRKRRERAMRELSAKIPHVSIRPEKIDDTLGRSPQFEQEQTMLEAGVGMDLNRNGIGLSNGINAGSVRTEGSNVKFGQSNTLMPYTLGKAIKDGRCSKCNRETPFMSDNPNTFCLLCNAGVPAHRENKPIRFEGMDEYGRPSVIRPCQACDGTGDQEKYNSDRDSYECEECNGSGRNHDFGDTSNIDYFTASEDVFEQSWDSITKAKRRYKGRRMYDDEESEEDERKSKAKRKRKKKRQSKTRKRPARGGRQTKSITTRRAGNVEMDVDRGSSKQAFHPNMHSDAIRGVGRGRTDRIPLRLRDPIAWERKKAYERMRRQQGSLPTGLTHHADTRGVGTKNRGILGGSMGGGTKLPPVARMGTSTQRFSRDAVGDPLGTHDALFVKSKPNITRSELMAMKRKVEKLIQQLNKLTKTTPELDNAGKVGAVVSGHESSAPTGATKTNEEDKAYRFVDMALAQEMGLVGKK